MSTLKFYAKTNIGSRPSKRGNSKGLNFSDLRAIPFVGSWSQSKQNVPGFFGVGTALKVYEDNGEFDKVIAFTVGEYHSGRAATPTASTPDDPILTRVGGREIYPRVVLQVRAP